MSINFKKVASAQVSLAPIMVGKTKLDMKEVPAKFPNGVTVTGFDFATVTDKGIEKTFAVIIIDEDPSIYITGGTILTNICTAWAAEGASEGMSVEQVSAELAAAGGVRMKFSYSFTKTGNNLVKVDII